MEVICHSIFAIFVCIIFANFIYHWAVGTERDGLRWLMVEHAYDSNDHHTCRSSICCVRSQNKVTMKASNCVYMAAKLLRSPPPPSSAHFSFPCTDFMQPY